SATALAPEMKMAFIAFPGTSFSSPHHYTVFLRGKEPFNSRLLKPVLVDAGTNVLTASPPLPWYLTALLVSQPLHFGDYGGMPMQIIWALLDIATIIVLGSGLYLWLGRRNPAKAGKAASPGKADKPAPAGITPEPHAARRETTGGAA
ncbi:MAG: PepSY domain-containing protein, partial [Polaromonas sp.]|nr:PepSY domain-containing protein [Polaromonas sp.]